MTSLGDSRAISNKANSGLTIWFSNCTARYFSNWFENSCPNKTLHTGVYRSFIHNCQKNPSAAKLLQSCLTLCDPIDSSLPGSSSLGFSRQEHWSGLPFPSPVHESEKSKWSRSAVSNSSRPHGLQPTRLLRPWDFPGKSTGVGCHCLLQEKH